MIDLKLLSSIEIVALTVYGEARGEPIEGQIAVACVIRNRLHNSNSNNKTYNDICLAPLQFSCWNIDDPNRAVLVELAEEILFSVPTDPILKQCFWVASGVIDWNIMDNTRSAQHYMTSNLYHNKPPTWSKDMIIAKEIENHVFLV